MSQDLFAAFGDPVPVTQEPSAAAWSSNAVQTPAIPQNVPPDDEDDFGDFEDASATVTAPAVPPKNELPAVKPSPARSQYKDPSAKLPFKPRPKSPPRPQANVGRHPFADHMDVLFDAGEDEYDAGQDEWNDLSNNPEAAVAFSKRVIQEQLDAEARAKSHIATPDVKPLPFSVKPKNLDVLFDADDLSDDEPTAPDDDWGDFEQTSESVAPVARPQQPAVASVNAPLPSMDLLGLDDPSVVKTRFAPSKHNATFQAATPRHVTQSAQTTDDPWDDFDDSTSQSLPAAPAKESTQRALQSLTTPTNIPPPSVLLSQLAASLKSTPTTSNVSALLLHAWVLGHVLAGRKLRWKRSTTLAASMRIGPAAAGGKSGMKLTGIDRGEVTKEDREVAEALTTWRAQVGKIRPLAAHAGGNRKAPDLTEVIPVRILKAVDGGFVAARECALCGLKREERAGKLDEDVQDSFGEWWVDNAGMHTGCAEWWIANEGLLRSR